MEQNETWKPVKGFEGLYEVSNLGRVRSLRNGIILKETRDSRGYSHVTLAKGKRIENTTRNVHRLVADAFIPNPQNLPQINHKNEIKWDNMAENLEWCTPRYNLNYGNAIRKITEAKFKPIEQLDDDGNIIARYKSGKSAEQATGISRQAICHCCTGKTQHAGGFRWRYSQETDKKVKKNLHNPKI